MSIYVCRIRGIQTGRWEADTSLRIIGHLFQHAADDVPPYVVVAKDHVVIAATIAAPDSYFAHMLVRDYIDEAFELSYNGESRSNFLHFTETFIKEK